MPNYTRREMVTRRMEYGVESGSFVGEFYKVVGIAWSDYCTRTGRADRDQLPDDWATVEARDDEIVLRFDIESEQRS